MATRVTGVVDEGFSGAFGSVLVSDGGSEALVVVLDCLSFVGRRSLKSVAGKCTRSSVGTSEGGCSLPFFCLTSVDGRRVDCGSGVGSLAATTAAYDGVGTSIAWTNLPTDWRVGSLTVEESLEETGGSASFEDVWELVDVWTDDVAVAEVLGVSGTPVYWKDL